MTSTKTGNRRRRLVLGYFYLAIGMVIVIATLFPLIWIVSGSFQSNSELFSVNTHLIPADPTLDNYRAAASNELGPLVTSITVGLLTVALSLLIAIPAAYAMAAFRWRWTSTILVVVLVTQTIPNVMVATPLYLVYNKLHLLNTYAGLVIADSSIGIPFAVLLLTAYLRSVPSELREAGLVDGASEWRVLRSIIVPVSRTAIISAGIFCFLFAWSDFLYALTVNTNGQLTPLSLGIYAFFNGPAINWGGLMATATIAIIPGAILLIAAQRYIAAGMTTGAVKG